MNDLTPKKVQDYLDTVIIDITSETNSFSHQVKKLQYHVGKKSYIVTLKLLDTDYNLIETVTQDLTIEQALEKLKARNTT